LQVSVHHQAHQQRLTISLSQVVVQAVVKTFQAVKVAVAVLAGFAQV
jgi:hypothetical protein